MSAAVPSSLSSDSSLIEHAPDQFRTEMDISFTLWRYYPELRSQFIDGLTAKFKNSFLDGLLYEMFLQSFAGYNLSSADIIAHQSFAENEEVASATRLKTEAECVAQFVDHLHTSVSLWSQFRNLQNVFLNSLSSVANDLETSRELRSFIADVTYRLSETSTIEESAQAAQTASDQYHIDQLWFSAATNDSITYEYYASQSMSMPKMSPITNPPPPQLMQHSFEMHRAIWPTLTNDGASTRLFGQDSGSSPSAFKAVVSPFNVRTTTSVQVPPYSLGQDSDSKTENSSSEHISIGDDDETFAVGYSASSEEEDSNQDYSNQANLYSRR